MPSVADHTTVNIPRIHEQTGTVVSKILLFITDWAPQPPRLPGNAYILAKQQKPCGSTLKNTMTLPATAIIPHFVR